MKNKINKILIAKDGYPLEEIQGRPVLNLLRRLLHGNHYECRNCYVVKVGAKNPTTLTTPHDTIKTLQDNK